MSKVNVENPINSWVGVPPSPDTSQSRIMIIKSVNLTDCMFTINQPHSSGPLCL